MQHSSIVKVSPGLIPKIPVTKGSLGKKAFPSRICNPSTLRDQPDRTTVRALVIPHPPRLPSLLLDDFDDDLSRQRCLSDADLMYLGLLSPSDILMEISGLDNIEEE